LIAEAIDLHIEDMIDRSEHIPSPPRMPNSWPALPSENAAMRRRLPATTPFAN
jgi:hypothetical protein